MDFRLVVVDDNGKTAGYEPELFIPGQRVKLEGQSGSPNIHVVRRIKATIAMRHDLVLLKHGGYTAYVNSAEGNRYQPAHFTLHRAYEYEGRYMVDQIASWPVKWDPKHPTEW